MSTTPFSVFFFFFVETFKMCFLCTSSTFLYFDSVTTLRQRHMMTQSYNAIQSKKKHDTIQTKTSWTNMDWNIAAKFIITTAKWRYRHRSHWLIAISFVCGPWNLRSRKKKSTKKNVSTYVTTHIWVAERKKTRTHTFYLPNWSSIKQ